MKLTPRKQGNAIKFGPTCSSFGAEVTLINPQDAGFYRHKYVISFGAYGSTHLMVYASDLCSAFEECAEYLATHAPGHITPLFGDEMDELLRDACDDAGIDFADFETLEDEKKWELQDAATRDLMYTESGYIVSYECTVSLEDPSREHLEAFCYPHGA
jgi:hypothetical protein